MSTLTPNPQDVRAALGRTLHEHWGLFLAEGEKDLIRLDRVHQQRSRGTADSLRQSVRAARIA